MASETLKRTSDSTHSGALSRVTGQLRQFVCSLHGHDALIHFEEGRMLLQCASCGYETPGWDLKGNARLQERVVAPTRVVQMPLVRERRVA